MIDRETITRLARLRGVKPFQEEKTYIQTMILRSIYLKIARDLVFKGGTALYLFHGLNRFSEDLDFTLSSPENMDRIMDESMNDLRFSGIDGYVKSVQGLPDSINFRFSCQGPLYTTEVSRVTVKIDISTRERILLEPGILSLDPPYPDILPFSCAVMNARELQAEKVRAILTRNKARDLYDLWFIFKRSSGDFCTLNMINSKLSYYSAAYTHTDFVDALNRKKPIWNSDLEPVIIGKVPEFDAVIKEVLGFVKNIELTSGV
ncbi:protein containing DUF1814 [mine drainage metagenome]|uniref:Protein containing DUF1814 n=1 Tax=mine drainage metagenome TaxID=410659 RepID=T0ZX34_9ZZZZ